MDRVWIVIFIIAAAGLLGGLGSYLAAERSEADDQGQHCPARYLVLGLIASAAVPMFLNILQSEILRGVFTEPDYQKHGFILFGFCAIAAFTARRFIDTLSARLIQQVERSTEVAKAAKREAADAKKEAETAKREVEEARKEVVAESALVAADVATDIADRDLPPPPRLEPFNADTATRPVVSRRALSEEELRVLARMMDMSLRTATGVASDIPGFSRSKAAKALSDLAERGLVERTPSPKTGSPRWRITPAGMHTLNAAD